MDNIDGLLTQQVSRPDSAILAGIVERYQHTRVYSEQLVEPLSEADAQLQSMPDASPAKWHLAHTTWFFETFILVKYVADYQVFKASFSYLFNSYYNGIGEQYPRHQRGLISRPALPEILAYRRYVDQAIQQYLCSLTLDNNKHTEDIVALLTLGIHHEQQHQELLLTDIKHALFQNPLLPQYISPPPTLAVDRLNASTHTSKHDAAWLYFDKGLYDIGYQGQQFCFDNELPRHSVFVADFALSQHLVTNAEYLAFIKDNGYQRPELWLSDGWAWRQQQATCQPLYWQQRDQQWYEFSLYGLLPLRLDQPVVHINYYEANAYACWAEKRLPTEFEWEVAAASLNAEQCASPPSLQPLVFNASSPQVLSGMLGQVWQWTSSSYSAYPGFATFAGAAGEYNGKFMSNQYVLRGSSCITPISHRRITYRNFFYAHQAWQFTGIRLAYSR